MSKRLRLSDMPDLSNVPNESVENVTEVFCAAIEADPYDDELDSWKGNDIDGRENCTLEDEFDPDVVVEILEQESTASFFAEAETNLPTMLGFEPHHIDRNNVTEIEKILLGITSEISATLDGNTSQVFVTKVVTQTDPSFDSDQARAAFNKELSGLPEQGALDGVCHEGRCPSKRERAWNGSEAGNQELWDGRRLLEGQTGNPGSS